MIAAIPRLALAAVLAAGSGAPGPVTLFRFADARITEASGIARGLNSPGVFFVQNDSGDSNRFFAVDRRTGRTAATVVVTGARNVDWEDIAVAPDAAGTPSVWLADIGDNDAVRRTVQVYRVVEPHIDATMRDRTVRVPVAQEWRVRYPGGPVDAEGLAVGPDGTGYLVTKSIGGASVYRLPADPQGERVQVLRRVGRIGFHATGTDNPFGLAGQLMATGATISADGSLFVVRTYADAWVWRLGADGLAAALRTRPAVVRLPGEQQGEGIAVVRGRLVVDSEGVHSVVAAVAVSPPSVATGTPTVGPTGSPTPARPPAHPPSDGGAGGGPARLLVLAGLLVGGLVLYRTASRARRPD